MSNRRWRSGPNRRLGLMVLAASWLGGLGGCAGGPGEGPVASPEQVEAARQQLLAPFRQEREVLCDDLVIEVTANFLQDLTQPSHDPALHRFEQDDREGMTEYRWVNPKGIDGLPFTFWVQQTKVVAVFSARLRVLTGRQPMTIDLAASGNAAVFHKQDGRMEQGLERVEVKGGNWRAQ